MSAVGFKEWALVCEALGRGEQSIILRKGGIHEGEEGFQFLHREFHLFPTLFHEQLAKTKLPANAIVPGEAPGSIRIAYFAKAEWTARVRSWPVAQRLAPYHIWKDSVVEERFRYEDEGLNLAFVRVLKISPLWTMRDAPEFGGCRSWVNLPAPPPDATAQPVLDEVAHRERSEAIRAVLSE